MDDEPFDMVGSYSRPNMPGSAPPAVPSTPTRDPPAIRTVSASGPPVGAFSRSNSSSSAPAYGRVAGNNKYSSAGSHSRTSSVGDANSAVEEDDDDEEEDQSIDNDIGQEYDSYRIRQEALRMLEVAEAGNAKYSVHRTASGGFTAQPRQMGPQRGRAALSGLNFVANARNSTSSRYADLAVASAETVGSARDDYEYGDESVVDRNGLEQRGSTETEGATKSSWSSRYAIDSTVLAMSGGAMRQQNKRSHTDPERLSALNLFNSSPTKNTEVFGSGFSFRQKHVFGKQNVSLDMRNLHNNDGPILPSKNAKSWQEQLAQKNRQRRRLVCMIVAALLFVFLVPAFSVYGVRRLRRFPADGTKGSVTFGVTNGPFDENDLFSKQIKKSTEMSSFTVHVGNIQNSGLTQCGPAAYVQMAQRLYDSSDEPIFIVPGEQDWNDCPIPSEALDFWKEHFLYFDRKWDATYDDDPEEREFLVFRQREVRENWAFLRNGVLFIGVHVVDGAVPNAEEFKSRNKFNYQWVVGLAQAHRKEIRAVVFFGNGEPNHENNADFFGPLELFWKTYDLPALYVHATGDGAKSSKVYHPFKDLKNFLATGVNHAGIGKPLLVNVGDGSAPFRLS